MSAEFIKNGRGKLRMDLLPPIAVEAIARVLTMGAAKYAPENWRLCPQDKVKAEYGSALLRHVFAWLGEETHDRESGEHHLAHAATNAMFIVELEHDHSLPRGL